MVWGRVVLDQGPKKTGLRTLRLPLESIVALEREAAKKGVTLNSLCNSILSGHLDFKGAEDLKMVTVPRQLFTSLLEAADDETMVKAVRKNMHGVWKDMAIYVFQDSSLEGVLKLVEALQRRTGGIGMNTQSDGRQYTISFSHDYGPKFSLLLKSMISDIGEEFNISPKFEVGAGSVMVRFPVPSSASPT